MPLAILAATFNHSESEGHGRMAASPGPPGGIYQEPGAWSFRALRTHTDPTLHAPSDGYGCGNPGTGRADRLPLLANQGQVIRG
eukprot:763994-Hanusia_phi.AAC.4